MRLFWEMPPLRGRGSRLGVQHRRLDTAPMQADILQPRVIQRPQLRQHNPAADTRDCSAAMAQGRSLPPAELTPSPDKQAAPKDQRRVNGKIAPRLATKSADLRP